MKDKSTISYSATQDLLADMLIKHKTENEERCLHDTCEECNGTGPKSNGQGCVHMISCPCPKHTFRF